MGPVKKYVHRSSETQAMPEYQLAEGISVVSEGGSADSLSLNFSDD